MNSSYRPTMAPPKKTRSRPAGKDKKGKGKGPDDEGCGDGTCEACKTCYETLQGMLESIRDRHEALKQKYKTVEESERTLKASEMVLKEREYALKERVLVLTGERDRLNLDLEATNVKKKKSGTGRWNLRHLSGDDRPAQEVVSSIVKECVFPNMKTLPMGWEHPNDEPRSIYGMIMTLVTPPNGESKEKYWEDTVRESVNYKFGQLKRQGSNKIRDKMYGELVRVRIAIGLFLFAN